MMSADSKSSSKARQHQQQQSTTPSSHQQQQQQQHTPKPLPVLDSVLEYEKLHRIGEGTYGVVYKGQGSSNPAACTAICWLPDAATLLYVTACCTARHIPTGQIVALKKVGM